MKHYIIDGTIHHKRVFPKKHQFTYSFFMLNINSAFIQKLKNKFFALNRFNLFSFHTKDHFGKSLDFNENIQQLLSQFDLKATQEMRYLTLPRILGFVFNPISVLLLIEEQKVKYLLAQVHNYNGGRIVYKVKLEEISPKHYKGYSDKDMYVSPYFKRSGQYSFHLHYDSDFLRLNVNLFEENKKVLVSTFQGHALAYTQKNLMKIFLKHMFLTFGVVFKTIYQSIILKIKGLQWNSVSPIDQTRRY